VDVRVSVKGLDRVRAFLARLGAEAKHKAEEAVTEYIIGDASHGLKHYPPYKHVPWVQNMTARQRRWLFAAIKRGEVTPGMSASNGYSADAWHKIDRGRFWEATNDVAHTKWLVGNQSQSAHSAAQGWRKVAQTAIDNTAGAIRHAIAELKAWLKTQRP